MGSNIFERQLSLRNSILILVAITIVIVSLGIGVGYAFVWNKYEKVSKNDIDLIAAKAEVKNTPKSVMAYIKLGDIYTRENKPQKALQEYIKADELSKKSKNPDDKMNAQSNLGYGYIGVKKYKEAIKILEPFIDQYPSHKIARYNLAYVYYLDEQYEKSVNMFNEAIKLDPGAADAYYYQALSYEKLGKKDEALKSINVALKFVPNYKEFLQTKERLSK